MVIAVEDLVKKKYSRDREHYAQTYMTVKTTDVFGFFTDSLLLIWPIGKTDTPHPHTLCNGGCKGKTRKQHGAPQ